MCNLNFGSILKYGFYINFLVITFSEQNKGWNEITSSVKVLVCTKYMP